MDKLTLGQRTTGGDLLERVGRDAIYGARGLRREPTFAVTAMLTLALGCVATMTVFSIVDAELWTPLPFPQPQQLVAVQLSKPDGMPENVSAPDYADWRAQSRLVEFIAAQPTSRRVMQRESADSVSVRPVTADFFRVLGVAPLLGRAFEPQDEHATHVALLSDAGWRRLFDADRGVINRAISLDGDNYTIVGVTAGRRLEFDSDPDFFIPIDPLAAPFRDRIGRTLDVYGRLRGATNIGEGQAELQAIAGTIASASPEDHAGHNVRLLDLKSYSTGSNWRQLYFFLAAAAVLMLLTCVNVANLLLARALRRQREFTIRVALGSGFAPLLRQLIVEAAVLATPTIVVGTLASTWLLRAFITWIPAGYLLRGGHTTLDIRVVACAAGLLAVRAVSTSLRQPDSAFTVATPSS